MVIEQKPANILDVSQIRADFPILQRQVKPGVPLVYLDSTATSQKPQQVIQAMDDYFPQPVRVLDKRFLMPIEDVFSISGRGTVITGRVERGIVKVWGRA